MFFGSVSDNVFNKNTSISEKYKVFIQKNGITVLNTYKNSLWLNLFCSFPIMMSNKDQ